MSKDEETEHLPSVEQSHASTGAAADSAEGDEELKGLPRLLRYAVLLARNESFEHERLIAEITAIAPGEPLTLAWAEGVPANGTALALQLDNLAVTKDQPDLRSLADCVRLLSLTVGDVMTGAGAEDHLRVGKALVHAYRRLSADLDVNLAADIEQIVAGWAALPSAATVLSRYGGSSAAENARVVGGRLANRRIECAEHNLLEQLKERRRKEAANNAPTDAAAAITTIVPADHIIVCKLDEASMKNPKMRELTNPFKDVINVPLPLVLVPTLHEARSQLLFEFPYARAVIDFALTDLIGRRTLRFRPLLLVGDAGGGKSRFVRRLGEILGVAIWRTDASRSDGAVFGGTDKRWYSAEPAHPLLAIAQAKHGNPIVLIDELEKAGTRSDYGRLWDCLLGFLEPETAGRYPDPALQTNLDLSQVSFIATANSIDALTSPLRDRFRIVSFPKPSAADLRALIPAVMADLASERGLDIRWVEALTGTELDTVAKHWRGGSVRRLRRVVEAVLRVREALAPLN